LHYWSGYARRNLVGRSCVAQCMTSLNADASDDNALHRCLKLPPNSFQLFIIPPWTTPDICNLETVTRHNLYNS
jgi:hypothetical protein